MLCSGFVRPWTFALTCLLLTSSLPAQAVLWPTAVLRVERDLKSQEVEVRRRAARGLRDLPTSSGTRLCVVALDDADLEVRLAGLDACLAVALPGLGDRLVPWLSDGERRLRLAAAEALSQSPSSRAVPSLGRTLGDADIAVRSAAASALGKSGAGEAVLALLGHLDDAAPDVRRQVALALGELGDPRAVVPLIGKIQDARPPVRESVARALAQLGDARAVSALVLLLRDSDDGVKVAALGALARIAEPNSVASIASALRGASDGVSAAALEALSEIRTPPAIKALIEQLDGPLSPEAQTRVVKALGACGKAALPALQACLNAESDPDRLGGCALALGQTQQREGADAIEQALRRGSLRPLPALLALAELRAPESLPTVLESLADEDVLVRRAARLAASALLDPRRPDGRAVEPLEHALARARSARGEQVELLDLLGKTGSPRAARSLLPFAAPSDELTLRSHALSALGFVAEAGQVPALLAALDDDSGSVRLAAALSLGRLELPGRAAILLDRLQRTPEQDRPLLLLALGATISRTQDPGVARRLEALLRVASGGERDALIELMGRMPTAEAGERLASLTATSSQPDDRAKFAEALAGRPTERARAAALLEDPSARVRANAAWALGEVGVPIDNPALRRALADGDLNVAGNALQALARIAARHDGRIGDVACPMLDSPRSLLRGLALRSLHLTAERCQKGQELRVLERDRAEFVRQSAAALLRDVPRGAADAAALVRARDSDASSAVAAESEARPSSKPDGVEATVVVVIAAGDDLPRSTQPFALLRADGLVRLGVSDRRGQLFEVRAPRGPLSLIEPGIDLE